MTKQEILFQAKAHERFQRELAEANNELMHWDISDVLNEEYEVEVFHVEQTKIEVGSKVTMINDLPVAWFKNNRSKTYPVNLTGIVTKVFKNGRVALRVKELDNKSMNYPMTELTLI
jgi:hypothetical protein